MQRKIYKMIYTWDTMRRGQRRLTAMPSWIDLVTTQLIGSNTLSKDIPQIKHCFK
jgi:hypothetical protein